LTTQCAGDSRRHLRRLIRPHGRRRGEPWFGAGRRSHLSLMALSGIKRNLLCSRRGQASCFGSDALLHGIPSVAAELPTAVAPTKPTPEDTVRGQPVEPSVLDRAMKQELPAVRSRSHAIHGEEKSRRCRALQPTRSNGLPPFEQFGETGERESLVTLLRVLTTRWRRGQTTTGGMHMPDSQGTRALRLIGAFFTRQGCG